MELGHVQPKGRTVIVVLSVHTVVVLSLVTSLDSAGES